MQRSGRTEAIIFNILQVYIAGRTTDEDLVSLFSPFLALTFIGGVSFFFRPKVHKRN